MVFSLPDTVKMAGSFEGFAAIVREQSLQDQLTSATAELWRMSVLHRRRVRAIRWAIRALLLSVSAVLASGLLSVAVL